MYAHMRVRIHLDLYVCMRARIHDMYIRHRTSLRPPAPAPAPAPSAVCAPPSSACAGLMQLLHFVVRLSLHVWGLCTAPAKCEWARLLSVWGLCTDRAFLCVRSGGSFKKLTLIISYTLAFHLVLQ